VAVGLEMDGLNLAQIPHQRRPRDFDFVLIQPALQVHLEQEGKVGYRWGRESVELEAMEIRLQTSICSSGK